MNIDLMLSSKYNMMLMNMVREMISDKNHLQIYPKEYLYLGTITNMSV